MTRPTLDFRATDGRSEAKRASEISRANKAAAERTIEERASLATMAPLLEVLGSFPAALAAAAELAALADKLERVRIEADRDADAFRARLERQGREYWIKRDLENGR